ncbi:MAG TPA: hydrogenase expression/formation protein HypE, partial [Longimicrobiales bacterium]
GGRAMRRLIEETITAGLRAPIPDVVGLAAMDDGAAVRIGDQWLVITTDSHVVQPYVFPGGDIGRLSIAGTVNDLAMMGATNVLGLTCAIVVEEGFRKSELEMIQRSLLETCDEAGVCILTGDTKVMGRGEVDGIVINTTGIALTEHLIRDAGLRPGDRIVVTGTVGDHGIALMAARRGFGFDGDLRSDVAPMRSLVQRVLEIAPSAISAMKDPTRGGVASAIHEMAQKSNVGVVLDETAIPLRPVVRAAAEMLGLDPLHIANEGKALMGVHPEALDDVLYALRSHPLGSDAAVIGTCTAERAGQVILDTGFGRRLLTEPEGEPVPRIC